MSEKKKQSTRARIIAAVSGFLFAAVLVTGYVFTSVQMKANFGRGDYENPKETTGYFYSHYENDYPRIEVSFTSDQNTLKGYIYGNDNTKGLIVFAHGIGGGHENYLNTITSLVDCGWKVFAYDATGSGHSEGTDTKGLPQSAIDLDKALTYAESDERLNSLPVFTAGHSWGGYAAAAVLNFDHDIKAAVSMSGYYQPEAELYETADGMFGIAAVFVRPFIWMYNKSKFGSLSSLSAVDGINKSGIPVLVTHGTADSVIHFNGASVISQKDIITNPNAEYYIFDEEGRNEHNTFLFSKKHAEYLKQASSLADEFNKKHQGNSTPEEREAFYNSLDRNILNECNPELISMIDEFFSRQLG